MIELNCVSIIDKVSKSLNTDPMSINIDNLWLTHIDNDCINGVIMISVYNEYFYLISVKAHSSNTIEIVDDSVVIHDDGFKDYGAAVDHLNKYFKSHYQLI